MKPFSLLFSILGIATLLNAQTGKVMDLLHGGRGPNGLDPVWGSCLLPIRQSAKELLRQ